MLEKIKNNFNTKAWALIAIAIIIDLIIPFASYIGTISVAVLCGPWAGALTRVLIIIFSVIIFGIDLPFKSLILLWLTYIFIGYFAGRMAQWGYFSSWWKAALAGIVMGIIYVLATLNSEFRGAHSFIDAFLIFFQAFLWLGFFMIMSSVIVFVLIKRLPNYVVGGFPQSEQIRVKSDTTGSQKIIAGIASVIMIPIVIILAFFIIFAIMFEIGGG